MKYEKTALKMSSNFMTFFFHCLAAQNAHFKQKLEFERISVSPFYNLLGQMPLVKKFLYSFLGGSDLKPHLLT